MDDAGRLWDFTSALDKWIIAHLRYPRRYSDFLKVQFRSINVTFCLSLIIYSRYRTGESPEQVASLSVADTWITHLTFSTWDSLQPGYCKIISHRNF